MSPCLSPVEPASVAVPESPVALSPATQEIESAPESKYAPSELLVPWLNAVSATVQSPSLVIPQAPELPLESPQSPVESPVGTPLLISSDCASAPSSPSDGELDLKIRT